MSSPVSRAPVAGDHRSAAPPDRDLRLPGFANLRDVGGYRAGGSAVTRWRVLLRSDMPADLGPAALRALAELPVGTVIDLRDDDEIAEAPSAFAAGGLRVLRHPIFDGSAASFVERQVTLPELYAHMITSCGRTLADAVRAIASSDPASAVLVHCSAGKDRTGVTVALALGAVGVDRTDVVADYVATEARLRGPWLERRLAALQAFHGTDLSGSVELLAGSPATAITAALGLVEAGWGSAEDYLRAHGLTGEDLDLLRNRLTARDRP